MGSIFPSMLDRFEVWRDAEALVRAWGPIHYLYPHITDSKLKDGSRVGVLVQDPMKPGQVYETYRYGHMTLGYSDRPDGKRAQAVIHETDILFGQEFHDAFRARRCLIPVDNWVFHNQKPPQMKMWYSFHPTEKTPMAFPGIYCTIDRGQGLRTNTVAILSLAAGEMYREFAHSMPAVFLAGPEGLRFINPKTPEAKALELLRAWPADKLMVEPCREHGPLGEQGQAIPPDE
jgi:putative SOS response-associated peptidase YedK